MTLPNSVYSRRRREKCLLFRLCLECGQRLDGSKRSTCEPCLRKRALQARRYRELVSLRRHDDLIDRDLYTVKEVAEVLGINRTTVNYYIEIGFIKAAAYAFHRYWISKKDLEKLRRRMNGRCNNCTG